MSDVGVPVIDLQSSPERVASSIADACERWGVFQICGHDVDAQLGAQLQAVAQAFFEQPKSRKDQIRRSAENPWGFFDAELTKNVQDWKEIVDIGAAQGQQYPQWPDVPAEFRTTVERYSAAVAELARHLTGIVLATLGDHAAAELSGFQKDDSFLRLNYYPPCANPAPADLATGAEGQLGISHHTDAGALTVLQQHGPSALQVLHNAQWHTIEFVPDALMINIGDVVQVWSNDRYPAPLHRVLAQADLTRYSAAYFYNPDPEYCYAPICARADDGDKPRYRAIPWAEFRAGRAAGDYADQGEEIQISHYRL